MIIDSPKSWVFLEGVNVRGATGRQQGRQLTEQCSTLSRPEGHPRPVDQRRCDTIGRERDYHPPRMSPKLLETPERETRVLRNTRNRPGSVDSITAMDLIGRIATRLSVYLVSPWIP